MRILFVAGLACGVCALVQCTPRQFNSGSEVKEFTDAKTIAKNPDGTYTVTCDWGAIENNVTAEQIQKGDICKITQVNPKAFNAFNIWNNGNGAEILDYPQGYDATDRRQPHDGVFYVNAKEFHNNPGDVTKFSGVPTEGAKVVNDVLEYPVKNGKQLKLRFAASAPSNRTQADALKDCKQRGLRLPTARELFDFCAAGVTEPNYGPNFKDRMYPKSARCGEKFIWSASLSTNDHWAFEFHPGDGYVFTQYRQADVIGPVLCVGPAQ